MASDFQTPSWALSTNIYEVNVRQYTHEGTFNAFGKHLPRLKDMGVQTLWFMPIHPIGKKNRLGILGSYYSISDHKAVNSEFGTLNDFKELVASAHQSGLKIMIDWVANHTAWDHLWTKEHPEFYLRDAKGNFQSPFDWKDVLQLDHNNPAQQDAMLDAMKFWVNECDIDGFRCDMAHLTPLAFWKKARTMLDQLKPLFWLAETEEPGFHEVFDATYTWKFLHTMESFWRKETGINGLGEVLNEYETVFPENAIRLFFTSNHDENSHSGSEFERMGDAAIPFAVLCATWGGIPLIYTGQEMALNKRLNFYNKDEIHWPVNDELHNFYKTLLDFHSTHPALMAGDDRTKASRIKTNNDEKIFAYLRKKDSKEVLVLLNLSDQDDFHFQIIDEKVTGHFQDIFSGSANNFSENKNFEMQKWTFLVFEK
ncbi:MAG TPA: alpha-amylase family glycosyl hydrolase [Chitinophagaceae bacterium]|nr:alpha-amylase family glycosyl hydrolase [Chitinophagaceae bacterium]